MPASPRIHRLGIMDLDLLDVGSYKTGCFYSEAAFGVPYELDLVVAGLHADAGTGTLAGLEDADPDATGRRAVLLHETAHFVQDLSLGVAVESDLLLDEALGAVLVVLRALQGSGPVTLPLGPATGRLTGEVRSYLELALDRTATARALFGEAVRVEFTGGPVERRDVSAAVLMEGLAAGHTARILRSTRADDGWLEYLAEFRSLLQLLPSDLGEPYCSYQDVFRGMLGPMRAAEDLPWPWDAHSPSGIADVGSAFVADIACHIPPIEIAGQRVRAGVNRWEDFLPGPRYTAALTALKTMGGFPDTPEGGGADALYALIFDLVADACGWPGWTETSEAWLGKTAKLKRIRASAGDAYRFRLLVERHRRPAMFLLSDPLVECWKQGIPVLHSTPHGIKILQGMVWGQRALLVPFEQPATPLAWLDTSPEPWRDLPRECTVEEAFDQHVHNAMPLFLQEVVSRTIGRSFQDAALSGDRFACPYSRVGCDVAREDCGELVDFAALPATGCAVRHWLTSQGVAVDEVRWGRP